MFEKAEQKQISLSYCYGFTTLMSENFSIANASNSPMKLALVTVPSLYLEK